MKKLIAGLTAIIVLYAGVLVAQGPTVRTESVVWNFVNGVQLAGVTFLSNVSSAITIGASTLASVTISTDGTGDAELVLPANSVGAGELTGMRMDLVFCGQAAENGTIYLSPAVGVNGVDFADGVDYSISGTACDGLDGATEATQDLVVFPEVAFKVMGMYCQVAGTLGAAETAVFTMRSAAADTVGSVTCTVSEAQRGCRALVGTTTDVAANAAIAVKVVETSDNSDDDLWCQVSIMLR